MGLNSGEVVVRTIGSDLRMDYSAVGQTTHLAARMEQLAHPDHPAHRRDAAARRRLHRGQAARSGPGEGHRRPGRDLRPRRGRQRANAASGGAYARPYALRGARYRDGAAARGRRAGARWPASWSPWSASPASASRVFSTSSCNRTTRTAGSQWKAAPCLTEGDAVSAARRSSAQLLQDRDARRHPRDPGQGDRQPDDPRRGAQAAVAPALWLLDALPSARPSCVSIPPERRRRPSPRQPLRRAETPGATLAAGNRRPPLDRRRNASVLDSLVASRRLFHFFSLVNYRPEYRAVGRQGRGNDSFASMDSRREAHGACAGSSPPIRPRSPELLLVPRRRNPLYLEEMVRHLVQSGALVDTWSIASPSPCSADRRSRRAFKRSSPLVSTASPRSSGLLQVAAVMGRVSLRLGARVLDLPQEGAWLLARLRAASFFPSDSKAPTEVLLQAHANPEVAYGGVLQEKRQALHARIVESMERLYA